MPSIDKKRKGRAVESDSDGDDSHNGGGGQGAANDAILAKVDPEYLNRPIDLKLGDAKLRALITALRLVQQSLQDVAQSLHAVAHETANALSEEYRDDEYDEDKMLQVMKEDPSLSGLEREFRSTLDRLKENDIRSGVISEIRGRIVGGHQITDVNKLYETKVVQPLDEYRQKTPRQRYLENKNYKSFVEYVWDALTNEAGVPNLKKFLPRDDADEEESDDEIEVGAQQLNYQCPITLAVLEDPYTSTVCPHSFSNAAIRELLRTQGNSIKCPVAGCSKTLTLATLEKDDSLRRRVEAHRKRVKEGRTQATQGGGRTYEQMDLSEDEDDEGEDEGGREESAGGRQFVKAEKR
ncbi:hypothetical protein JCM6882_003688 [Rhodosporidiobolus microsporus]